MARVPATPKKKPSTEHLFKWGGVELVDGTVYTESVFWDTRMDGVLLLDGSHQFFPAAQVRRCWWDNEPDEDVD